MAVALLVCLSVGCVDAAAKQKKKAIVTDKARRQRSAQSVTADAAVI